MTVPARAPLDRVVQAGLANGTQRPVGLMEAPTSADGGHLMPYAILYPIDGGGFSGPPFAAPEADGELVYQVTSVGGRADQCQQMADRVRNVMLARTDAGSYRHAIANPPDMRIMGRRADGGGGGMDRATGGEGDRYVVFSVAERFVVAVTPA